jgi:hypothetical protein
MKLTNCHLITTAEEVKCQHNESQLTTPYHSFRVSTILYKFLRDMKYILSLILIKQDILIHMQCYHHIDVKELKIHSVIVSDIFIARINIMFLVRST